MLTIQRETPLQDAVIALLAKSDAYMAALYPAESNHLLDPQTLAAPHIHFFVARWNGEAVGCAALVIGEQREGELKRMYVDAAARGKGAGRALLACIEETARVNGIRLLQLETGGEQPEALGLYRAAGFRERGPFGSYQPDPLSLFMEKQLQPA
ncbi:MAG TPA: GNAT family N-acetyltransferase [Dongiaceae bacterium]|nr:GNAT family N-acetyltransferase [Dongiaceae bacterium]